MSGSLTRYAVILAAVALTANSATTGGPGSRQSATPTIQHSPIEPHRDERGNAKRNVKNSLVTQNWSGYAVANFQTSLYYGSASGTWQVPEVTWGQTSGNPYGYEYSAIWVGIGGFCENASCSTVDQNLIQLGTEQVVSQSGVVSNYVWYELYPAVSQGIHEPIQSGDIITASLECTANCVPNQTQTWHLTITDQTLGWTWAQDINFTSSMLSAEWIVEAPYYGGILPLNNYTQANFDPAVANGGNPNLSLTTNSIVLNQDPYGQTSNPSDVINGDWFGGCWGYGSLTPCTAASFVVGASPAPTASLSASPASISTGGSSTLSWNSSNAASCAGSGFSASGTSGSAVVYPSATTTYSLTCSGPGGSATASATVTVSSGGQVGASSCNRNGKGKNCG